MPRLLNPFLIPLFGGSGAVLTPEITITGNGQTISDGDNTPSAGDNTDFGLSATLSTVSKTFNIAASVANLTGVSVALSGSGAAGFTITDQPDATINAGDDSDFTIRYDALTPIAYAATVTISSNELDDVTFDILASSLYSARVLAQSPFRYNQLNEGSGTTMIDSSTNAFTGDYSGITWDATQSPPMLGSVPTYDATNDYTTLHSAAYAAAFDFDEGFALLWLKVAAGTVWTDGTARTLLSIRRDANNNILISKSATNNRIVFSRTANGTGQNVTVSDFNQTGWISIALSWSVSGNALMAFRNGVQIGTTQTGLVNAAGSGLSSTLTTLGAGSTVPAAVWNGYLRDFEQFAAAQDAGKLALMEV